MKEIGKFCRMYCHLQHKKWPELVTKIEEWLNGTMSDSTGYSPVELMYGMPRPDLFSKFLSKSVDEVPPTESLQDSIHKNEAVGRKKKQKKI
jgi:hypothetical protein